MILILENLNVSFREPVYIEVHIAIENLDRHTASCLCLWSPPGINKYICFSPFHFHSGSGAGTTLYIIDSGILHTHKDFGGRATNLYDFESGVKTL